VNKFEYINKVTVASDKAYELWV